MDSIDVHVFDSADLVAKSLVAPACTVADRGVDAANSDPNYKISWS